MTIATDRRYFAKEIARAAMIEYGVPEAIAADAALCVPTGIGTVSLLAFIRPVIRQHSVFKAFRQPPPIEMDGLGLA